jgi:hypothetical protein
MNKIKRHFRDKSSASLVQTHGQYSVSSINSTSGNDIVIVVFAAAQ